MISGNVIEEGALRLENLINGGGTSTFKAGNASYGVAWFDYTSNLIKNHYYFVCYKYYYKATGTTAPTWVRFYPDGGSGGYVAQANLTSNNTTETTAVTGYGTFYLNWQHLNVVYNGGRLYHGESSQTANGTVTPYYKAVCLFDITQLYCLNKDKYTLAEYGKIIWPEIQKWMEKGNTPFLIDPKTNTSSAPTSNMAIATKGDYIYGNIVEAEGLMNKDFSPNSTYGEQKYYMDENWLSIYNYKGASNKVVTHTKVEDTSNPFYPEHPYVTKIVTTNAEESTCAPNLGGFVHSWYADKTQYVIVQKLIANVPTGYDIQWNGYLGTPIYQSDTSGTGTYKEYTCIWKDWSDAGITNAGKTSMSGYVSIKPKTTGVKNVIWYVAFYGNFQFTKSNYQTYQGFSVMPNKDCIKGNTLLASKIDSQNLLPNGDGSDCKMTLPSKYQWATDINDEIEGYCCLRQPSTTDTRQDVTINGQPYIIGEPIPINPMSKYRLTYRVKAEVVPDSYLSAIVYYRKNSDGTYQVLNSINTTYINGTRTTLAQDSDTSKNTLQLTSVDNWKTDVNYAGVGFKTNPREEFKSGDVQRTKASSKTCLVMAVDTTTKTITLVDNVQKVYKAGTYVYQSQDQSSYYYPAQRSQLKAGEWVSIKAEFGNPNQAWDGTVAAGGGAWGIPFFATHMGFAPNIYANSSGKPIYYDNIRIEEIYSCGEKRCDKVQIKRYDGERKGVVLDGSIKFKVTCKHDPYVLVWLNNDFHQNFQSNGGSFVEEIPYKDSVFIKATPYPDVYGSQDNYYKMDAVSLTSDDIVVTNNTFIMPYRDVTFEAKVTSRTPYYRLTNGIITPGIQGYVYSADLTNDFEFQSQNVKCYVKAGSELLWAFLDVTDVITTMSNPYVKITTIAVKDNTAVTIVYNGPLSSYLECNKGQSFCPTCDIMISVEAYDKLDKYTVTLANPSSNWCIITDDPNLTLSNKSTTCYSDQLYIWKFYSYPNVGTKAIFTGVTFSPSIDFDVYNDTISFWMPFNDLTLTVHTEEKTKYELKQKVIGNGTITFTVGGVNTKSAAEGDTVSCSVYVKQGKLISVACYNADTDEWIMSGTPSFTFTMPANNVLVKAVIKLASSGEDIGEDEEESLEGEQAYELRILNIPGTLATRAPRDGTSLNKIMCRYRGAFYEFDAYYDNCKDQLISDITDYQDLNINSFVVDWNQYGVDYTKFAAARCCYSNITINFWVTEDAMSLDVLICTDTLDNVAPIQCALNLQDDQFNVEKGQLQVVYSAAYRGYYCTLWTTTDEIISCIGFALNGDTGSAYFIPFANSVPLGELSKDANDTYALCPGFQDIGIHVLQDGADKMDPLLLAENNIIENWAPSNLDGQLYSLYNDDMLLTETISSANLILTWFDPENTYITYEVIDQPTRDYASLVYDNDWVNITSRGGVTPTSATCFNESLDSVGGTGFIDYTEDSGQTILTINFDKSKEIFGDTIDLTNRYAPYILYMSISYKGLMWSFLTPSVTDQETTYIYGTYDQGAKNQNFWIDSDIQIGDYTGRILNIACEY